MKSFSCSSKSLMSECYISNDTQHKKNEHHGLNLLWRWWSMGNQIFMRVYVCSICNNIPSIEVWRFMTNLKYMKDMFNFLSVANTPRKH